MRFNVMAQKKMVVLLLLLSGLLMHSCKNSPKQTKMTFMPDMADAPTVKAQQDFLPIPDGVVARNAMLYPPMNDVAKWEKLLHNPFSGHPKEAEYKKEGAFLFEVNCATCHGPTGKGDGTIKDVYPQAPDISSKIYLEKADGYFFHKVTVGGPIMPSRAEHTSTRERWKIILHLRELQNNS